MNQRVSQRAREIKKELYLILPTLKRISDLIEGELPSSGERLEGQDEDEHFLIQQLRSLPIDDLVDKLEYLQREIVAEGFLRLNEHGRYQCEDVELTSGSTVELFVYDTETRQAEWILTRIEYADRYGGYYAYDIPELELNGVRARIRR